METERKLSKKEGSKDQFVLTSVDKEHDLTTIKGYKKQELKNIYAELKAKLDQVIHAKRQLDNQLKAIKVQETPDLVEFMDKMIAAQELAKKKEGQEQMEHHLKDIVMLKEQAKEISLAVPEVLRN